MEATRSRSRTYALREKMLACSPPLVLVAEDDADVRSLVCTTLRHDGWSVVEAEDGAALLEHVGAALLFGHLRGELDPIALVISDIRMPGAGGLEVLGSLRGNDVGTSVILMTAYADAETRAAAARLGADALLAKPFEVDELRRLVRDVLGPMSGHEDTQV